MNTTIRGRIGECLAAESYQKQGFTILKRNYRFGRAEVDIIAQKGDTLAIVEVKWRSNTYFGDPQSFVSKKQQRYLITAANHYVNSNGLDVHVRFDIVSIVGKQPKIDIQIIENPFYPFFECVIYNKLFNYLLFSRWIY